MKDYTKSADAADGIDNDAITFKHWGKEVTFHKPSEGQEMLMLSMGGADMKREAVGTFIQIFLGLADDDSRQYFLGLMADRKSGFRIGNGPGEEGEGTLIDIWRDLMEEWSGKDSKKPSASRASRSGTGASSTARSPRRASTSSKSRSTNA
jgi:hypothetical protein